MGKEAREARRDRERLLSSHPAAAVAAELADDTFARQWQSAEADYGELISSAQPGTRAKFRLDVEEIHAYVDILRRTGYDWPTATYLPMSLLGAELVRSLLADLHAPMPGNEAELGQVEQLGMALSPQVATLAAWNRAPLVAAFDDDLVSAPIATPMTGELPHSLLQQLPTWTVFIPTPWLAADTGVYVTYDTGQITKDGVAFAGVENGVDDFVLLFVSREAERAVVVFVRCSERTIGASINAQAAELEARTDRPTWLGGADAYFEDVLRRPTARSSRRSCRWSCTCARTSRTPSPLRSLVEGSAVGPRPTATRECSRSGSGSAPRYVRIELSLPARAMTAMPLPYRT
jgi:hypothetical protein